MNNTNAQGKSYKVAATQETITAQNSANQGTKKNFDGTKELFNAVSEEQLQKALSYYNFGIVKPGYIISNLKMAQRLIDRARMSEEQKAVLRNSYGFLLIALAEAHNQDGPCKFYNLEQTEKELWRIENEMRDILNEWVYEDGGTYQHTINPRGPGAYDEDRKQLNRLAREYKSFGEDLPDDIYEMIEAADRLTELYRLK